MSEDKAYKDGDIVWVKLGNNWWPGEVTGPTRHPEGLIKHLKRVPYCVVKFFNENTYEYVRSSKQIFPFQCAKQKEFIRKGYSLYNSGNSFMEKFPNDVELAKELTHRKQLSLVINDRPDSIVKAILGQPLIRTCDEYSDGSECREKRRSGDSVTKILNITQNRNNDGQHNENLLTQTSIMSNLPNDNTKKDAKSAANNNNNYQCNFCDFTSVRLNVMILHRKMHSNRNSVGSNNSTSSKPGNAKSTPERPAKTAATTTTTNINTDRSHIKQKEIIDNNKSISKTKVSTITTPTKAAAASRTARTPSPLKESTLTVASINEANNSSIDVTETAKIPLTTKEKSNRLKKLQTSTDKSSRIAEKNADCKQKVESDYAAILSDFCISETETSPSSEEKQSRRSLRNCKNVNENTTENVSTVCIDLSETKTIQKIPKKREYSLLHIQHENSVQELTPAMMEECDVVCLSDKEKDISNNASSTGHTGTSKSDAEEIRRMLLADWSDDDETPLDAVVVDDGIVVENAENNESIMSSVQNLQTSATVIITSTPVVPPTSGSTGRIRNIPKKDRRDVVLQDFNSDLSHIQNDNADHAPKNVSVDLDSSNSSVVEIIEDKHSAAIITINDDEEQEKNQVDIFFAGSKDTDSAVGLTNDKSASAATSTTTLSCFDFQEDEDEQESNTTTISHFKKKYLSGEKLQQLLSTTNTDEIRDEDAAKNRAEMAEKDQRLTAEIETILQQTKAPVTDLLNANSFEESISVKDLPIKERGKRIFKSRNKTRMEDKTNTEILPVAVLDVSPPTSAEIIEGQKSNVELTAESEDLINSNDKNELEPESKIDKGLDAIPFQESLISKNCVIELPSQVIVLSPQAEISNVCEDKELKPNENKENEVLSKKNNDCLEVSNEDHNKSEDPEEQIDRTKVRISDSKDEDINNEKSIENISTEHHEINDNLSERLLNDGKATADQQDDVTEENQEQESLVIIDEMVVVAENATTQNYAITNDVDEGNDENYQQVEISTEAMSDIIDTKHTDNSPPQPENFEDVVLTNDDKVLENKTTEYSLDNSTYESPIETIVPKSPKEISVSCQNDDTNKKDDNGEEIRVSCQNDDTNKKDDNGEDNNTHHESFENIYKIRVKSSDQLFDQAFVMASQQESESQQVTDSNVDARLINTTPTDENSSMGASDTGAEFGSPTSMLSEERLPAFRFQSNQTPQQEMEIAETEVQRCNAPETSESEITDKTKENVPKEKSLLYKDLEPKLTQQRRFSEGLDALQIQPKLLKRQRLSVDITTSYQENDFEKPQEILKSLTVPQTKNEGKVRPKSRHMKITPRRNVRELFKAQISLDQKDGQKSKSLESINENQPTEDIVDTVEKQQQKNESVVQNSENPPSGLLIEEIGKVAETNVGAVSHEIKLKNTLLNEISENIDSENANDKEVLIKISEDHEENRLIENSTSNTTSVEKVTEIENKEEGSPNIKQAEIERAQSPTEENSTDKNNLDESPINPEENRENTLKTNSFIDTSFSNVEASDTAALESKSEYKSIVEESTDETIVDNLNHTENSDTNTSEIPMVVADKIENVENDKPTESITVSLDNNIEHKDQGLQIPFSPGIPPPTPQEREVVIESETISQVLNTQQEVEISTEGETDVDVTVFPLTPQEKEISNEIINQLLASETKEHILNESENQEKTLKENVVLDKEVYPLTPVDEETINDSNTMNEAPEVTNFIIESETLAQPSTPQQSLDIAIECENNVTGPCSPKENIIEDQCKNAVRTSSPTQTKDLIIECEPSTPLGIIECDKNILDQVTPEKESIIESDNNIPDQGTTETESIIESDNNIPEQLTPKKLIIIESQTIIAVATQNKNITIEENLQLEEKDSLLAQEFQVLQAKENSTSVGISQESQPNSLQTDADKAAEEFLIEFDNIVNHSHTVEEGAANSTVEEAINAEDLVSNIIEEVHDDPQPKQDAPTKSESSLKNETMTTYTVVAPKNSWNQIFKDSFSKQLPPSKRRQTICFEISDTKEGVACKKQALDLESISPATKPIKRTAERKLTLPAIETKLSNYQPTHNILALNHNQLILNKKFAPTSKRKLSIEDNITSFIIERPKQSQQPANTTSGPPPLQKIRSQSRQGHTVDNLSEPSPLQSQDILFTDLFPSETSSPTPGNDVVQRAEGARVIHQQIISSPHITSVPQNKTIADAKISKNKQIGVDSRGNKYVIIKTPPTDIVVQPTLTSTTASAVTGTNNYGTTITIQPIPRSTGEISITKSTTKSKNISSMPTTSSSTPHKHHQQQMKQISITVPAKSALEMSHTPEVTVKAQSRNRRKTAQAKAIAAATTANSNINSAKHRQAMEALSRRLSIASEAPPLAKMSRTSSTHVQTQISNNSNRTTIFGDAQLSNIAQQQLMQLQQQQQQQQQQQTQTITSPQPPPIILNKNAHQHSVMKRKMRKLPHHLQQQQQQHLQHQQLNVGAKSSQLLQQQQQNQVQQQQQHQQQHQQIQQHQFITQITSPQQQQQQQNPMQPPPLQQIQPQTIPMQQQLLQQSDGIIITAAATEDDNVLDSMQLIALPTQPYPGYSETFLLCKVKGNTCKPVDNVPLYLNHQLNELVPVPLEALEGGHKTQENQIELKTSNAPQHLLAGQNNGQQDNEGNLQISNLSCNLNEGEISAGIETDHQMHHQSQQQQIMEENGADENGASAGGSQINDFSGNQEVVNSELVSNNGILLNIEGQQVLLDATTFAHLLANPDANTQLISDDGTEYVLTREVLAALQMQQEQQQALELANAAATEQHQQLQPAAGSDIIAVALAGSDLYDNDVLTIDTTQGMQLIDGDGSIVFPAHTGALTQQQQHLTPPAVVTNAVLDQSPIMSTLEVPSSIATTHKLQGTQIITVPSHHLATSSNAALGVGGRSNLEDSLAAIGVTTQSSSISSSLGLPITVTNPNIASKVTSAGPLNEMLQFVSHRPATAAATAAAVAAAALAGESRIFTD